MPGQPALARPGPPGLSRGICWQNLSPGWIGLPHARAGCTGERGAAGTGAGAAGPVPGEIPGQPRTRPGSPGLSPGICCRTCRPGGSGCRTPGRLSRIPGLLRGPGCRGCRCRREDTGLPGLRPGSPGTFTRHFLQNLSPGWIGFPHARQAVPGSGAGAGQPVPGGPGRLGEGCRRGCRGGTERGHRRSRRTASPGSWASRRQGRRVRRALLQVQGERRAEAPRICAADPAELLVRASGAPQERHTGTAGGGAAAAGDSSISDAPQFRKNFCVGLTLLPHSGQNGIG